MPQPRNEAVGVNQIALPLDWPEQERPEDFIVTDANREAARHLSRWATWPLPITVLSGPRKSGRSLLARLFAASTGGRVIDDAWDVPEETIFHAWNEATARRRPLLIVADAGPPAWTIALPDLASRIAASPRATILPPDDALLRALIERGLARRGLDAAPRLVSWLLARIERSYVAAQGAVDALDRAAFARRRRLTIALAREALVAARSPDAGVIEV